MAQAMSRLQAQTSNFGDIGLQDLGSVVGAAMSTDSYSVFTIHHSVSWIGIIGLVSAVVTLTASTILQVYCNGKYSRPREWWHAQVGGRANLEGVPTLKRNRHRYCAEIPKATRRQGRLGTRRKPEKHVHLDKDWHEHVVRINWIDIGY